ncbi:Inorganic phosphate transporter pho84, partial [Mortierella sp. AD094]
NNVNKAERDVATVLKENRNHLQSEDDNAPVVSNPAIAKGSISDFCAYFSKWDNFKVLFGTSMAWFALDRLGRIKIQILGFVMSCILFCALGFAYDEIRNASSILFIVLFALTQFFQNFGPNSTTFIIPGEVFPTRYRSTGHGIAAGSGKLGAIIAQVGFSRMKDNGGPNAGIPTLLKIFALFMLIGLLVTFLIPETKGKTLEELSNEDEYYVNSSSQRNDLDEEK